MNKLFEKFQKYKGNRPKLLANLTFKCIQLHEIFPYDPGSNRVVNVIESNAFHPILSISCTPYMLFNFLNFNISIQAHTPIYFT